MRGLRQRRAVADHANAAGGAAGAAAAHARMRDIVAQAGLEHAEPLRHANRLAVAIGQHDHAGPALVEGARALRQQHKSEQAEIADQEIILDALQDGLFGRRADLLPREIFRSPFLAVAVDHASPALIEAEHGQRRNQHRRCEQKRRRASVERLHPQPEIQTDTAMDPGNGHDREHQPDLVGPRRSSRRKAPADRAFRVRTASGRAGRRQHG